MNVVTRFAPSPTGALHIGGARTALFNLLHARHHGGRYLLRIEDTDARRTTPQAVDAIFDALDWLGLAPDEEAVFQSKRRHRHVEVVETLLAKGMAYPCYATREELDIMRAQARKKGQSGRCDSPWRDKDPSQALPEGTPVIRFKALRTGETVIEDLIQGTVRVANKEVDDMILLRADKTPTYMLSAAVDDHDMGITDVIRGDDHLTNTFRQIHLFMALDWPLPRYAHMPLLHGTDGRKLSKRHGALGVAHYKDNGYLPDAVNNYLLRLGWAHGNDEVIDRSQAVKQFDVRHVGRSPARFDQDKLDHLNGHYLRQSQDEDLVTAVLPFLKKYCDVDTQVTQRLRRGMAGLKMRATRLDTLAKNALIYVAGRHPPHDPWAHEVLTDTAKNRLSLLMGTLEEPQWSAPVLEAHIRGFAREQDLTLGELAPPLRAALTGRKTSPPIFEVMDILGKEETLARLSNAVCGAAD